jgi:hypothetical protein
MYRLRLILVIVCNAQHLEIFRIFGGMHDQIDKSLNHEYRMRKRFLDLNETPF